MNLNNTRRKIVLGVVLFSAIAVAGLQNAGAGPWRGGPDRWTGPGCWECDGSGYREQGLRLDDEKSREAREAFLNETAELRKSVAVKKAEMHALMRNENPDSKRVAELTGELFDLREQLQKKAQEKGLDERGFGRGFGRGCDGPGPRRY